MGKIVQKQTKILHDNVKRNLIGAITLSILTIASPAILFLLPDPTALQISGLIVLFITGLTMALFMLKEYIHDHHLYLAISTAATANEERTIHCHKIKFRTYATDASSNYSSSAIWAIVLIDGNRTKYTYILEEVKPVSGRRFDAFKQELVGKELVILCYQNTNVIKQIRNVNL